VVQGQNADIDSARLPGVISAKQPRRWFELIASTRFTDLREDLSPASAFAYMSTVHDNQTG